MSLDGTYAGHRLATSMKALPRRKGNRRAAYWRRDRLRNLNESPSQKEGKFSFTATASSDELLPQ